MTDWERIFDLTWRQRDANIEMVVRKFLADKNTRFTTRELSEALDEGQGFAVRLKARLLVMAPYLEPFARHDGEEFKKFGRTMRRWNWYGQNAS
jgi:hypothetical protein